MPSLSSILETTAQIISDDVTGRVIEDNIIHTIKDQILAVALDTVNHGLDIIDAMDMQTHDDHMQSLITTPNDFQKVLNANTHSAQRMGPKPCFEMRRTQLAVCNVCVCVCVRAHACARVCGCACAHARAHVCVCARAHARARLCVWCARTRTRTRARMCVCVCREPAAPLKIWPRADTAPQQEKSSLGDRESRG